MHTGCVAVTHGQVDVPTRRPPHLRRHIEHVVRPRDGGGLLVAGGQQVLQRVARRGGHALHLVAVGQLAVSQRVLHRHGVHVKADDTLALVLAALVVLDGHAGVVEQHRLALLVVRADGDARRVQRLLSRRHAHRGRGKVVQNPAKAMNNPATQLKRAVAATAQPLQRCWVWALGPTWERKTPRNRARRGAHVTGPLRVDTPHKRHTYYDRHRSEARSMARTHTQHTPVDVVLRGDERSEVQDVWVVLQALGTQHVARAVLVHRQLRAKTPKQTSIECQKRGMGTVTR